MRQNCSLYINNKLSVWPRNLLLFLTSTCYNNIPERTFSLIIVSSATSAPVNIARKQYKTLLFPFLSLLTQTLSTGK